LFVFTCWVVFLVDLQWELKVYQYGVFPRSIQGLRGILFSPFIHSGLEHLVNNSVPLLVLGTALFYFYKDLATKFLFWCWIMAGLWLWASGRESYHIGASGIIYALASFLFFSGIFRQQKQLIAISLLVTFLYGSMVWGILPIKENMSYEGHFWGGVSGLVLAIYFRKKGPQRKKYDWEDEEDDELEVTFEEVLPEKDGETTIQYHYKPK
jgi:membrane associated rhomboid family serine protease